MKVYFPGLNGLRFFAAFAVIICHVELFKATWGFQHIWNYPFIDRLGSLGVDFFFALSGFLITYLLFAEKQKTSTISIKDFLLRRVYRIWPLYYLLVALVFFVLPNVSFIAMPAYWHDMIPEQFGTKLFLYLFLMSNVALAFFRSMPYGGVMWSIGVEEQFYILWPILNKYGKDILAIILSTIAFFLGLKVMMWLIIHFSDNPQALEGWKNLIVSTRMECMAIGALGSYLLYYKKENILNIIYKPFFQLFPIALIFLLLWLVPLSLDAGLHFILSFLSVIIILNVSTNPQSILKLENRFWNHLGKISYGIYMYHMIVIAVFLHIFKHIPLLHPNSLLGNIALYFCSVIGVVALASVSYQYFEEPFIKMKRKHTKIVSGEEAK
ncbi:MAG: acyltransferase family protein [Bacteroidia bacterium]